MRLPWPFRFLQRVPADAGRSRSAPVAVAQRERRDLGEWRKVPPIKEVVGPPPLVAPTAPFAADLGAGHTPPPVLAPLGHGKGLDAPSGIVAGLARPVQRAAGGSPRPLAPRRSASSTPFQTLPTEPVQGEGEPAPLPVAAGPSEPGPNPRRASVVLSPVQRAPLELARVSARQVESIESIRLPGVVGQPALAGRPGPPPIETYASPPPIPSILVPSQPASAALPGRVLRKPDVAANLSPVAAEPAAPRLTLGQTRRLGLGAPIKGAPATAKPIDAPATGPRAPLVGAQLKPADTPVVPAIGPPSALPAPAAAPVSARPVTARAISLPPASPALPAAPLVSARPLPARVQRAPLGAAHSVPAGAQRAAAAAPSPQQVKVHRGAAANELAESLQARAFTHEGDIYLPSSAGPLGSTTARRLVAHEMTHVAQQRTFGRNLPEESSSRGQELERLAVAAEQRLDLPLAQSQGIESHADQHESLDGAQRKPATAAAHPHVETTTINLPASVQRAPDAGDTSGPGTPGSPKSARPQSDADLEELAGQLYGRISRRLRRELLVDRERAGVMVDLR